MALSEPTQMKAPNEIARNEIATKPRILIVDDLADNRMLWQIASRAAPQFKGWRVEFAECGQSALEKYDAANRESYPYALLILDIAMPEMSGIMVAKEIRERGDDTKIAFLTAYDRALNHHAAQDLNAEFWTRPMPPAELAEKIEGVLNPL